MCLAGGRGPAFLSAPPPCLQEAARDHCAVVALYRSHLLYAIQVSHLGSQLHLSLGILLLLSGPQFPLLCSGRLGQGEACGLSTCISFLISFLPCGGGGVTEVRG
jgi:hypothetical protein